MGNQNGKTADRSVDVQAGRSPLRTKLTGADADAPTSAEHEAHKAGEGTSGSTGVEVVNETEKPIDKYQVTETSKEATLEVSTMATELGSSTPLHLKAVEEKDKTPFIDIGEVKEGTKDDAKSPLVSKSDETTDLKNKSVENVAHDEKPSNVSVTAGEKESLLDRGVSGDLSESGVSTSTTNYKTKKLTQSNSLFKSCFFCLPNATT